MDTNKRIQILRAKRRVYQARKTEEYQQRVASCLSKEEKEILFSGDGFVRVPDEEPKREKIDAYPYLIQ